MNDACLRVVARRTPYVARFLKLIWRVTAQTWGLVDVVPLLACDVRLPTCDQ